MNLIAKKGAITYNEFYAIINNHADDSEARDVSRALLLLRDNAILNHIDSWD
jgi:hypothetical protein